MKSYTTLLVLFFSAMIMITCSRNRYDYMSDSERLDENLRRSFVNPPHELVSTKSKQNQGNKYKPIKNTNSTKTNETDAKAEAGFNVINGNTEKIHNQICRQRWEIRDTLNQISNQLKMTKEKVIAIQTKGYSKQKLYVKFARIANLINLSVSELKRIGDLIEILKCANCDRLNDLVEQYNSISSIPENIVNLTTQAMTTVKISMNLAFSK